VKKGGKLQSTGLQKAVYLQEKGAKLTKPRMNYSEGKRTPTKGKGGNPATSRDLYQPHRTSLGQGRGTTSGKPGKWDIVEKNLEWGERGTRNGGKKKGRKLRLN